MKNLSELFAKYERVYPALHKTLLAKGVSVDDAEDILHDFFIKIADKINWNEEDKNILSFIYKGLALHITNRPHALKNMRYVHNNREIMIQDLYIEDSEGDEKEYEIEDKHDIIAHYSLVSDMKNLLSNNSITGNLRILVTYYVEALENNACVEDFRRTTIANSMGVTKEYVRKMSNILADYLSAYAPCEEYEQNGVK